MTADEADGDDRGRNLTEVFAKSDWYLTRPEPERLWRGVLRRRPAPGGPADRPSLTFALVTADGPIPVYAAGVDRVLRTFQDEPVIVRAKLVDLRSEGFDPELWIGELGAASADES